MNKILCFGDSNTYGYNTELSTRYDIDSRWSGILKQNLKNKYEVVECGLNNRTAFYKNPLGIEYTGNDYLNRLLEGNNFDIIIFALGTNDLQFQYNFDENFITNSFEKLIKTLNQLNTKIIVVPPVIISKNIEKGTFNGLFNKTSADNSIKMQTIYQNIIEKNNLLYFDFNTIIKPSEVDFIHYSMASHKIIGENITNYILNITSTLDNNIL